MCLEHLPREAPRWQSYGMPEPPKLAPFHTKEKQLYSEPVKDDWASYPIPKGRHHFEELLNLTNTASVVEAELVDDVGSTSVSLTEAVKHFHGGKASRVNEMLKGLGVVSLTLHGRLEHCTEWLTRWWSLFSQRGDMKVHASYRCITSHRFLGKVYS